jgi:cellulase/cellobiase CelA1
VKATTEMRSLLASMAELPISDERLKKLKREILDKIVPVRTDAPHRPTLQTVRRDEMRARV